MTDPLRALTHSTYDSMLQRCYNPNHKSYEYYGERGIKICDRWKDGFGYFLEDMGLRPSPQHTIDRLNSDGDYEPGNCRWATWTEQRASRRPAKNERMLGIKRTTPAGESYDHVLTVSQWSAETGIKLSTIHKRLKMGWSVEKTLTTPVRSHPAQSGSEK